MSRTTSESSWDAYGMKFHNIHAGITEEVLIRSHNRKGETPYEWILQAIPDGTSVLDVACGSAPILRAGWEGEWHGIDRSAEELARIERRYRQYAVVGSAEVLPFEDATFDVVICSMALMLVQPLLQCLIEMMRTLREGGVIIALLPGDGSALTLRDRVMWARILAALRMRNLTYPNAAQLQHLCLLIEHAGGSVAEDQEQRFALPIAVPDDGALLVRSLYAPRASEHLIAGASHMVSRWEGQVIGIPLRRIVGRKIHSALRMHAQ